jgi:hypothetical protein
MGDIWYQRKCLQERGDGGKCLVSREVVVGNVGSANCDFESRCQQQEEPWHHGRVPVKAIFCLRNSSVNRVAVGWEVKSVGLDVVVQSSPLEHVRPHAFLDIIRKHHFTKSRCIDELVLIDYRSGAHHHSPQ